VELVTARQARAVIVPCEASSINEAGHLDSDSEIGDRQRHLTCRRGDLGSGYGLPATRRRRIGRSSWATSSGAGRPIRLLASAVAYSRVRTGVHYPGDVVLGSIVGAGTSAMVAAACDRAYRSPRH